MNENPLKWSALSAIATAIVAIFASLTFFREGKNFEKIAGREIEALKTNEEVQEFNAKIEKIRDDFVSIAFEKGLGSFEILPLSPEGVVLEIGESSSFRLPDGSAVTVGLRSLSSGIARVTIGGEDLGLQAGGVVPLNVVGCSIHTTHVSQEGSRDNIRTATFRLFCDGTEMDS